MQRLKDSDVTWLYGPLHTANVEPVRPLRVSTAQDRLGIDNPAGKPGILKHRTLTELLAMPGQSSPGLDAVDGDEAADAIMADMSTGRPQLPYTKSDTNLGRSNSMPIRRRSPSAGLHHAKSSQSKERSPDSSSNTTSHKRHISFNTFVEQVISLDEPVLHRGSEDSDDSDDVLEMRLSRFSSHGSRASSTASRTSSSSTIAKIPPGMLKTAGLYTNNAQLPKLIYAPTNEYRSPVTEQPPAVSPPFGATSPVGIATGVGAGPAAGRRWSAQQQDDDFSKGSFDYFGGPDLSGTSPQLTSPNTATFARVPAVNAPPAQPKWRQAQTGDTNQTGGTVNVSSSSSSSSLNNPASVASPQPGRSILKVRPANNNPAPPEIVSPPVLFNYNPSVATGIGGMFGSYEGAAQAGLAIGSPPNDPTEERGRSSSEERGRSTSRGYGSSQFVRSASRNSSSSSVGSVSRSPVDTGIPVKARVQSQPSLDQVKEGAPWHPSPTTSSSSSEAMDVDYSPERSFTPTPHSSPQVSFFPRVIHLTDAALDCIPADQGHVAVVSAARLEPRARWTARSSNDRFADGH